MGKASRTKGKKKLNRSFLKVDQGVIDRLMELFHFVDNINKTPDLALRGGIYRELAHADVFTRSFDGWEVGYKLEDHGVHFRRKIFVKCEQPLHEIPDEQKDPVFASVMEVFLERGQSLPIIEQISQFAMMLTQDVIPFTMVERNPNLVSKGRLIH